MLTAVSGMQRSSEEAHLGLPKTPHLRLDLYRNLWKRWLEFIFEGSSFLYLLNHWPLWTIHVETVSRVDAELFSFFFCLSKILTFHGLGELLPLIRLILLDWYSLILHLHLPIPIPPCIYLSPPYLSIPLSPYHLCISLLSPCLFPISLSPYLLPISPSPYLYPYHL